MNIPRRPLNQYDLLHYVKLLKISHFRGVFMRDNLPKTFQNKECGILNLDSQSGPGTHWTCWYRLNNICYYFDSFGLTSPIEFNNYIKCDVLSSTYKVQKMGDVICGHLCLLVLYNLSNKKDFEQTVLDIKLNC